MKIFLIFFFLGLCGCQAIKLLGGVPLEDYQLHVSEIQTFAKDVSINQGLIAGVASGLAQENVLEAKDSDDSAKLERSLNAKLLLENAAKTADKLADTTFTKTESTDWEGILMRIATGLFGMLMAYFGLKPKLDRITEKAKLFASSDKTHDIKNDKDFK